MFSISGRAIGRGYKPYIVAEVAQAHDGSVGIAHSFIDAVADTGADAIKFQTHIANQESTKDEEFRIPLSGQDKTRYDYWKRMEFTAEQWHGLFRHAQDKNITMLSSTFSVEAVNLMQKFDMPAYKVGSGEWKSEPLWDAIMATGKPLLFSTGMSTYDEIRNAVHSISKDRISFALFQCTSSYPTPLEDVGINVIEQFQREYECPVGLSDHSGTPWPSLFAMGRGADLIEVHVTFDRKMYGPDATSSLTFDELQLLCNARDAFDLMKNNPVDKDKVAKRMLHMRNLFSKSVALSTDLRAGTVLKKEFLVAKKPGTGIPFDEVETVIGKRLNKDITADRLLRLEDLE